MGVRITSVEKKSPSGFVDIRPDDILVSINGALINDILDYRFFSNDSKLVLEIERDGKKFRVGVVKKNPYQELGLDFDGFLMDEMKSCRNNCVFCFIDQNPKGMRETIYFKDDDMRMSFLLGNYITMTNLSEDEIERIINLRISPINVSVHTTNPDLRKKMLNNRFAGNCYDLMKRLAENRITMNCQIVLCPGINDKDELVRSLKDLEVLHPYVNSVSVVPVGITKHREGLCKLTGFDRESAKEAVDLVMRFGDEAVKKHGTRIFYLADEFFIKAQIPIPEIGYYEDFPQIENGVGLMASLEDEFKTALGDDPLPEADVSIATGTAAAPFLRKLCGDGIKVFPITNNFYGETVDVSGLVCGSDLIEQLKSKNLGRVLLIPKTMLRHEQDMFLDNVTLSSAQEALNIKIIPVPADGGELLDNLRKEW